MKVAVLGAGAWGTAIANHLAKRHDTVLWARDASLIARLIDDGQNATYLPDIPLIPTLHYQTDLIASLQHAVAEDALCVIAIPVAGLRALCNAIGNSGFVPAHLIWLCKGFEVNTRYLPHQIIDETFGNDRHCSMNSVNYGVLSGPSFAKEVAQGLPTALIAASASIICRERAMQAFHHSMMRIYTAEDVVGVEVGGAVKNVLAIAAGISDGLALGLNARAALMTRGLAEMMRLGSALGGCASTFMGLAGLGDLILTATSDLSRNRSVGLQLAKGQPLHAILGNLGHIAEGVHCAKTVLAIARAHAVDMPITQAVCAVLFDGYNPRTVVNALLQRDAKAEK